MISEDVKSIVEAEQLSEKEIRLAEENKMHQISQAEITADDIRKKGAEQLKKQTIQKTAVAKQKADQQSEQLLQERCSQIDKQVHSYSKNKEKAVKAVLESII